MKLEYIILIVLLLGFYEKSIKDDIKQRKNRKYIDKNLKVTCKIITYSGIIGEVSRIKGEEVIILTGDYDSINKVKIKKSEIKNIISKEA